MDVSAQLPRSDGSANGTFAGDAVNATWDASNNVTLGQLGGSLPASLEGVLVGPVSLAGAFAFQPGLLFQSATISGSSGGRPVQAVATNEGGRGSVAVKVAGSFAGTAFSVVGSLASDLSQGIVRGTVGSDSVEVLAKAEQSMVKVTGTYRGPAALFALIAGSLLFFL
ncbi:MAG TPA: hypothetical protein VKR22_07255 [Acidimicrobiales bacterium]|nr:hypothetical protein [Acidimicrobiales bacterium]